jgi:hypothetical protein
VLRYQLQAFRKLSIRLWWHQDFRFQCQSSQPALSYEHRALYLSLERRVLRRSLYPMREHQLLYQCLKQAPSRSQGAYHLFPRPLSLDLLVLQFPGPLLIPFLILFLPLNHQIRFNLPHHCPLLTRIRSQSLSSLMNPFPYRSFYLCPVQIHLSSYHLSHHMPLYLLH